MKTKASGLGYTSKLVIHIDILPSQLLEMANYIFFSLGEILDTREKIHI